MAGRCKACLITGLDVAAMTGAAYCQDCVQRLPQGVCPNCTYINGELDDICKQCGASVIIDSTSKANDSRKLKPSGSHPEAPHKKTQVQQIATSSIPTTQVPMDTSTDDTMPAWAKSLRADILMGFDQVIDSKLAPLRKISDTFNPTSTNATQLPTQHCKLLKNHRKPYLLCVQTSTKDSCVSRRSSARIQPTHNQPLPLSSAA